MNPLLMILAPVGLFLTAATLFAYLVGRWRTNTRQTAVSLPDAQRSLRLADMARLTTMRRELETYLEFDTKSVCLFYDICVALEFDQAQVQRILGPAYFLVIDGEVALPTREEEE